MIQSDFNRMVGPKTIISACIAVPPKPLTRRPGNAGAIQGAHEARGDAIQASQTQPEEVTCATWWDGVIALGPSIAGGPF